MKRQAILKSTLCLLMAMVCNVAWADFTQKWTASPMGPWGTTNLSSGQYPSGLSTAVTSAGGNVRMAEMKVTSSSSTVIVSFAYTNGGHDLNILGVDIVDANGVVKASHYGHSTTGSGTSCSYALNNLQAGATYFLRYFVSDNGKQGDRLAQTNGTITVMGLSLEGFVSGDLLYSAPASSSSDVQVLGLRNTSATQVAIPETVAFNGNTHAVTSIGDDAFYACTSLTSVTIPSSVTSIGSYAFYECYNLTSVNIPSGVTNIEPYTFAYCKKLTNVTIPYGVTTIGKEAFRDCFVFTDITVPESVTSMGVGAFRGCIDMVSITLPSGLTNIQDRTFYDCWELASITIPEGVTNIGSYAFFLCSNLKTVINLSVLNVERGSTEHGYLGYYANTVFFNASTGVLYVNNNYDFSSAMYYPWHAARELIASVEFGTNVTRIGYGAVSSCSSLTSVSIPNSVTSIGSYAFYDCSALTSVSIPNSVTSIGSSAFQDCSALTSLELPANITYIPYGMCWGCSSLLSITIPFGVTSIGEDAFYNCTSLTTVSIPSSVTSIGVCAFQDCYALNNVTIPEGVTSIAEYTFDRCSSLTSINIPSGVTSIGEAAFRYCSSLTSVDIPDGVLNIGQSAFACCSSLTDITISASVTSIGSYAFEHCWYLTSIDIPTGITCIKKGTFNDCRRLTSITIPASVTSIENNAFYNCSELKTVINLSGLNVEKGSDSYGCLGYYATTLFNASTGYLYVNENYDYDFSNQEYYPWNSMRSQIREIELGPDVTHIGISAFSSTSLTSVTIPEGVTSIGNDAFYNCTSLTSVSIPSSVTSIGTWAFQSCSSLTNITIPEGVTSIANYTFDGCSSLSSITIPASVTSIGNNAFQDCSSLTSITIPASVTIIGDQAFHNCSNLNTVINLSGLNVNRGLMDHGHLGFYANTVFFNAPTGHLYVNENYNYYNQESYPWHAARELITSVEFGPNVTSIGSYAFENCSALISVSIPNSVTSIGSFAFDDCSALTSVSIPNSVTNIGNYAFYGCSSLESITIPEGVTSIGTDAFSRCSSLASITIPKSVASIGEWAFCGCSSLTSITIPEGLTIIGDYTFYGCSSLPNITIPNSVTSIGGSAFRDCSSLESITIHAGITSIGDNAFYGCSRLGTVINLSDLEIVARSEDHGYVAYYTDAVWDEGVNDWSFDKTTGNLYVNYNFDGAEADDYPWHSVRSEVKSVNIGSKVTKIGYEMFAECENLTSITIPNGVVSIGNFSFNNCSSLTSITIPASVTDIQNNALLRCTDLSSIIVNSRNARYRDVGDKALVAGDTLVVGCTSGYIPEGVTVIGDMAFMGRVLDNSTLEIPEGVTSIERYAFVQCQVSSIHLPKTLKKCAYYSFCATYSSVPVYITEIHIDDLAAWFDIDFDENSNPLETGADFYVGGIPMNETITTPAGLTVIKEEVLSGWKGHELIISEGVETISNWAFFGMKNLTAITIPSSVTSIGTQAFMECGTLQNVYCYAENVPATQSNTFEYTDISNATLHVPAQAVDSYRNTAPWSGFGNIVSMEIPVAAVTLSQSNVILIEGETYDLEAYVSPEDATNKTVTWYTNNSGVATVDVNGVVTATGIGTTTIEAWAAGHCATCEVVVYTPGDVNHDGMVLVDDIVLTINKVLGIDVENFLFAAADMDSDSQIMVNDVVQVINTALGISTISEQSARSMMRETMTASMADAMCHVSVSNATDYVAMQLDMVVPEGMSLDGIRLTTGNSHSVITNLLEDGTVRVVVTSLANEAFAGNQLLDVCLSGDAGDAIEIANVYLSTAQGDLVKFDDEAVEIARTTTHIAVDEQAATTDIYDLNGRLVKKNATSTEGLAKGVYLMNGKKITVK